MMITITVFRYTARVSIDFATLERIESTSADVDFARGSRRVMAALVYYPAKAVGTLVRGAGWVVAAWKVGYADGRRRS